MRPVLSDQVTYSMYVRTTYLHTFLFHNYIRGHTVNAVCESFQGAKDAGFKVKRMLCLASHIVFPSPGCCSHDAGSAQCWTRKRC